MRDTFYITTAIAYVNGAPHIGHALEFIQTDAIARAKRQRGSEVHFLTGTDEHGVKIVKTAAEQNKGVQELVDENAQKFRDLKETFNLSWDDFIRTTDYARHLPGAQKMWQKLVDNGDLYQQEYEGLYCYGCEEFKKETDLVDGNCPIHHRPPEVVKEKNWFFRLSKYSDAILQKLESGELAIVPAFRSKEIINVVKEGLHDVSFSRPRSSLEWGIPVPNDPDQVMYVWCDALTNYISAAGYADETEQFKRVWPADMHVIGKDIVRFHAGIWIGMLMSADLPLPKSIFVHGFVTSEGQKMSKSLGNVVDPVDVAAEWGADALRWYLLSEVPTGQDGDFSRGRFIEKYNAELADSLGNLVSRVVAMATKHNDWSLAERQLDEAGKEAVEKMWAAVHAAFEIHDLRGATQAVLVLLAWANKWITQQQPWTLKADLPAQRDILATLLEVIRHAGLALLPCIPATSEKIAASLGADAPADFATATQWGAAQSFAPAKPEVLFPKKEKEK